MSTRTQDFAAAAVGNKVSMVPVVEDSAGSHRARELVWEPQRGDGDGGCGYMGWIRYNILRPSCSPADGRCWRVPLVECNVGSMSPGSSVEGLQVLRGSRGPYHLREIRDEAGLVPAEKLRLGTGRAPLKELQCLQNMVRTADRRSCLVRMGTAKQESIAWKLKENTPLQQH